MRYPTEPSKRVYKARIDEIIAELGALPPDDRPGAALALAAAAVEFAAYESAQSEEARQVARLILLAADVERLSETFLGRAGDVSH